MEKQVITSETLLAFQKENNLTEKDMKLMVKEFHRKNITNSTVFPLGTPTEYKSKFFKTSNGTIRPDSMFNYWILTEEGKEMMKKLEDQFIIPTNNKELTILNVFLFNWSL